MKFATRTQKTGHSGLEDLFAASGPNVISFAGGYPDRDLFPTKQLNQAFSQNFTSGDRELLQYARQKVTNHYVPRLQLVCRRLGCRSTPMTS